MNLLPFGFLSGSCEQAMFHRHVTQHILQSGKMLGGQDLSRCHEAGLVPVIEGNEHTHQGHQCFSAANISLQQTIQLPA